MASEFHIWGHSMQYPSIKWSVRRGIKKIRMKLTRKIPKQI
jgi:hypothetical protein